VVKHLGQNSRRRGWHSCGLSLSEVQEYLSAQQPELVAKQLEDFVEVTGKLLVVDEQGALDSFSICMEVPNDYPESNPLVWESGGRIPRVADRHIFWSYGNCCLGVWEAWLAKKPDPSFAAFMDGPMADYFLGQSLVDLGYDWPVWRAASRRVGHFTGVW